MKLDIQVKKPQVPVSELTLKFESKTELFNFLGILKAAMANDGKNASLLYEEKVLIRKYVNQLKEAGHEYHVSFDKYL